MNDTLALDMRSMNSFGQMIEAYDAFVKAWHRPPDLLLMTTKERQQIYPDNGTIHYQPYKWRGVPIKEVD